MGVVVALRRLLPTSAQRTWLCRGLDRPGGRLPLFEEFGQTIDPGMTRTCIEPGWGPPWYPNPQKSNLLVCRLTPLGRIMAGGNPQAL